MKRVLLSLLAAALLLLVAACGQSASSSYGNGIRVNAADGIQVDLVEYERSDDGIISLQIDWAGE